MWLVKNQTAYAVKGTWIRNHQGEEIWTVALKATWDILHDGTTSLSAIQTPLYTGQQFQNNDQTLLYDTDFGPTKVATDIVINGHAYAPNGRAVCALNAGLKIGSISRVARIFGARIWDGRQYGPPEQYTRIPLCFTKMGQGDYFPSSNRYFNPVGIPVEDNPETGISALPHFEFMGDKTPGFGAIPRQWPGRAQFAGTYDENWRRLRAPLFPDDLNERFWQCSPAPLYAGGQLKGGEVVCLGNLTPPEYGRNGLLIFELPQISPTFTTQFFDGSIQEHHAKLHTVIIEPDFPRVSLVWHSALACHRKVNLLESTTIFEKQKVFTRTQTPPERFPEWEALL